MGRVSLELPRFSGHLIIDRMVVGAVEAVGKGGHRCTGLDVETTRVEALAALGIEDLRLQCGNGTRPDFGGEKFNVIVSQQLFEHLHPDDAALHLLEHFLGGLQDGFFGGC